MQHQIRGAGRSRMSGTARFSHAAYMANLLNEDLTRGIVTGRANLRTRVRDRGRNAAVQLPTVGQDADCLRGGAGGARPKAFLPLYQTEHGQMLYDNVDFGEVSGPLLDQSAHNAPVLLSLIHISEPTRRTPI
eukprot:2069176-Pleurochrysis_carterae.AAC.2